MPQFNGTQKQVTQRIAKIDARALSGVIQAACTNVIGHAMAYGHSPLGNALQDRMDSQPMLRKHSKTIVQFMTKHGPFNHSTDTGYVFSKAKRDALREEYADEDGAFNFDAWVIDVPHWDEQPKADREAGKPLDAFKALEKLADNIAKRAPLGTVINADLERYIRAVIAKYTSDQVMAKAQAAQTQVVERVTIKEGVGEVATAE